MKKQTLFLFWSLFLGAAMGMGWLVLRSGKPHPLPNTLRILPADTATVVPTREYIPL